MIRLALLPESVFALSLLATYLAHSTLWFLVAWAVTRPRLALSAATRGHVWRAALVGPLVSSALALAVADGWRSPAVELALTTPAPLSPSTPPTPVIWPATPLPVSPGALAPLAPLPEPAAPPLDLGLVLLAAAAAVAAGRLVLLGARQLRFWRRLRDRRPLFSGAASERLRQLSARAALPFPARLSLSPLARGPMALGRGEICLPPRALDELPGPGLSAVLAHEIAHLERRDNGWLTAGALVEAVLFVQPLTRLVRREMSAAAELACDERAVELTDSPVALARSIAIVAAWQLGGGEAVPVSAMARTPLEGDVVARVKRLLSDSPPAPSRGAARRARLVVAALLGCGLMAPAIGGPGQLQAAGLVPMPPPKATQAANRLLGPEPPAWQEDADRGDRPRRWPGRVAVPRPPRPPRPPRAALPPMPPMPPMPPSAFSIGPSAARMAALGMQLAELHASRAGEPLTDADRAKIKAVEQEMEGVRRQMEADQKRFAADMQAWGKQFEQQFGKEYQRRMEAWGREHGKQMEDWHRKHGRDLERWGQDFARRMGERHRRDAERMQRHQERLQRHQEMRQRADEARQRAEEARHRAEEERRRAEDDRRRAEDDRRRAQEKDRR